MCSADSVRPNVLLIVADDLGVGDVSSFNATAATTTTNIDALAAQGTRFTRFYTESTCSTSRAALLTGQYPARLGFHPVARGISSDVMTLPKLLQSAGYTTALIGKWHVGEINPRATPHVAGFHRHLDYLSQWLLQGPDASGAPVLRPPVYQNPWLEDDTGQWRQHTGYLPDILTQAAVDNIGAFATTGAPWFLLYASPLPHAPLHWPSGVTPSSQASDADQYRAMVQRFDQDVGRLLDALERSGQRQNTVVILVSDNGAPAKREGSNGVYAGGKGSYTEGGIRTLMIWQDPERTLPSSVDERPVTMMDVLPTLAARLSLPVTNDVDGLDVLSSATLMAVRDRPLFWLSTEGGSVMAADKNTRYAVDWMQGQPVAEHWYHYDVASVQDRVGWRWLAPARWQRLKNTLTTWMDDVLQTPVQIQQAEAGVAEQEISEKGMKVTGADFLRTPLKSWDFYIAARFNRPASNNETQVLAEQAGVWSLSYQSTDHQLQLSMLGGAWTWPLPPVSDDCVVIGINADVYDRYTNVDGSRYDSRVRVSLNGETVATETWRIDSLQGVDERQPTWIGQNASGQAAFTGDLSVPYFFHRGSAVSATPFLLDEKKRLTGWCQALE